MRVCWPGASEPSPNVAREAAAGAVFTLVASCSSARANVQARCRKNGSLFQVRTDQTTHGSHLRYLGSKGCCCSALKLTSAALESQGALGPIGQRSPPASMPPERTSSVRGAQQGSLEALPT